MRRRAAAKDSSLITMKGPESETQRWKLLARNYRDRGMALVLGAGVSTGCNLPGWPELIRRVALESLGATGPRIVDELIQRGMTLPAITAVLEAERPSETNFQELLRQALYRDFPFNGVLDTQAKRRQLVKFVHGKSPLDSGNSTMRAVAAFCVSKKKSSFVANSNVHAVITSNVDAVLRTYVRARYDAWLLRTIESAKHNRRTGRIPTYYMHGFLHFRADQAKEEEEHVPTVFTEAEYFDFFNRPHSVFNYTFLYILREYHCLFVGMSMDDTNIRRLLHYSVAERRGTADADPRRTGLRHFALLPRPSSREARRALDVSLRLLGTRALWIKSFDEIPRRLGEVYGTDWPGVYGA